jgi:hypothetical protein
MKPLKITSVAVLAALAVAAPASAHTLEKKPAIKAGKAEAAKIAEATDPDRYDLKACARKNRHTWTCMARFFYTADNARCEVPLKLFYKRHSSRRITRERGATLCY